MEALPPLAPAEPAVLANRVSTTPHLQIAHVLFMDIVGYGRLTMNVQGAVQVELQRIVESTAEVQQARQTSGELIIRPTGDGMALLFFNDLLSPVRCAVEITNLLAAHDAEIKARTGAHIRLRMGVHTGPVLMVEDLNRQADVAGDGIVIAQRVMDCGDAGHILLSGEAARALEKLPPWSQWLTDLGTCAVKHGVRIHVFNLCGRTVGGPAPFGNVAVPTKVHGDAAGRRAAAEQHEATIAQWTAEDSVRPYMRSLVMLLLTACLLGLIGGAWALVSPQTLKDAFGAPSRLARFVAEKTRRNPSQDSSSSGGSGADLRESRAAAVRNEDRPRAHSSAARRTAASPAYVAVPDMTGSSFEKAKEMGAVERLRLFVSIQSSYSDDQPAGLIYRQEPAAGAPVPADRKVYVAVSKGPAPSPDDPAAVPAVSPHHLVLTTPAPPPAETYTGVIIDATHQARIVRERTATVIGPEGRIYPDAATEITPELVRDSGLVVYGHSASDAAIKAKCGTHPLVLVAEGLEAPGGFKSSIRLSPEAAEKWHRADEALNLTQTRRVGVLLPADR